MLFLFFNMNVELSILSAENSFIPALEEFFSSVYDESSLPSHGIDHHRRVWNYAKELLIYILQKEEITDPDFVEKLLIACYLHDIGMAVDPGERHGVHSRRLCEQFLTTINRDLSDYQDVLAAIDNHDNKEYRGSQTNNKLLLILSVADDLDAFGYTGIYRYLEICISRENDQVEVGNHILENVQKRYNNFILSFGYADELVQTQKIRFNIIRNFFMNYNRSVSSYSFSGSNPYGYCGIYEIIFKMQAEKKIVKDWLKEPVNFLNDEIITDFFRGLIKELS